MRGFRCSRGSLAAKEPPVTDESDWIELYRAHVTALYGHVSRRVGGRRDLAEDVTQETWLRAINAWRRKGPPRDPLAWLTTVASNLLRNHFRRRRPEPLAGLLDFEGPGQEIEGPEQAALVQWALSRLRESQARLVEAYHHDGLSVAAIATRFGLSERAVEGRLRRARSTLRELLKP